MILQKNHNLIIPDPPYRTRHLLNRARLAAVPSDEPRTSLESPPLQPKTIEGVLEKEEAVAALERHAEQSLQSIEAAGGNEEMRQQAKDQIISLRDGARLRILSEKSGVIRTETVQPESTPAQKLKVRPTTEQLQAYQESLRKKKESEATEEGDYDIEFPENKSPDQDAVDTGKNPPEQQAPAEQKSEEEKEEPRYRAVGAGPGRTVVRIRDTESPPPPTEPPSEKMGYLESWRKRLNISGRPQNAWNTVEMAFHEGFAAFHRRKIEKLKQEYDLVQKFLKEKTKKPTPKGTEQLQAIAQKLERKMNSQKQLELKWDYRRDAVARDFAERLEATTDPVLAVMDKLERKGKDLEEKLVQQEQLITKLRETYRTLRAQGADTALLSDLDKKITQAHRSVREQYKERESISGQLLKMDRATSVWIDRRNELHALMNRVSSIPTPPPQEVAIHPEVSTPVSGAIRSPEQKKETVEEFEKEWNTQFGEKRLPDDLARRMQDYFKKQKGPGAEKITKKEFSDLLLLLRPEWNEEIRTYQK